MHINLFTTMGQVTVLVPTLLGKIKLNEICMMRKMEKLKKDRINAQKEKAQTGHSGPFWMPVQGLAVQKVCSKP